VGDDSRWRCFRRAAGQGERQRRLGLERGDTGWDGETWCRKEEAFLTGFGGLSAPMFLNSRPYRSARSN
jgi:hypothetical protein